MLPNTDSLAMQIDVAQTKFPVSNSPQVENTIKVMKGELGGLVALVPSIG